MGNLDKLWFSFPSAWEVITPLFSTGINALLAVFVPKAVPAAGPDGTLLAGGGTLLDALDLPADDGVPYK